ncbi:lipid phosphate phosphatase 2-like isoform X3 [Hordeum vulgare subsp. vulgare]|uniref:lipid phosphate phosphatase 2-like isoform X3 n=1 Tax=Hordeum vulgare subsp. vulgare TaxID=112509 RepID=UPI001D1A3B11|nr:lipid phosphate phosphatase 2-like isoform X3 [Hordeum vulgare subsp. vulgare]
MRAGASGTTADELHGGGTLTSSPKSQVIGIVLPCAIFGGIYFKKKNFYDLHHGILGILYSVLITAVITDAIKDGVGRPRPDFFWRCFPDGKDLYDNVTTGVLCHGENSVIKEGHKSFPSGHSSWSFAGLGFLTWYLTGKIAVFDRKGHIAKLCIIVLPLLAAALVAVSRVDDYWHHWQDVFAGAIIGLLAICRCCVNWLHRPHSGFILLPAIFPVPFRRRRVVASRVQHPPASRGGHCRKLLQHAAHGGDGGRRARSGWDRPERRPKT